MLTEARVLRHEDYFPSSRQSLNRRSELTQSSHLCARIFLSAQADRFVVHNTIRGGDVGLRESEEGLWWWSHLDGCVFWGDDPDVAVVSTLDEGSFAPADPCEPLAVELFLFWTRQHRAGRVSGIGKGKKLSRANDASHEPFVFISFIWNRGCHFVEGPSKAASKHTVPFDGVVRS